MHECGLLPAINNNPTHLEPPPGVILGACPGPWQRCVWLFFVCVGVLGREMRAVRGTVGGAAAWPAC